jgi:hypothetical protein
LAISWGRRVVVDVGIWSSVSARARAFVVIGRRLPATARRPAPAAG